MNMDTPEQRLLSDGTVIWELDHALHREDGPARISPSGSKSWYLHDKRHREGGPAIEMASGTKAWFEYGLRHREGGPAVELSDGRTRWWFRGRLHREDGPAIDDGDGKEEGAWFVHGRELPLDEIVERKERLAAQARLLEGQAIAEKMHQGLQKPILALKPPSLGKGG
jgi:hypothetical protein